MAFASGTIVWADGSALTQAIESWDEGLRTFWLRLSGDPTSFGTAGWLRNTVNVGGFIDAFNGADPNGLVLKQRVNGGGDVSVTVSAYPQDGTWHHVAVWVDESGNTMRAYFDGAFVGSAASGDPFADLAVTLAVGVWDADDVAHLAEAAMWGSVTQAQAELLIAEHAAGLCAILCSIRPDIYIQGIGHRLGTTEFDLLSGTFSVATTGAPFKSDSHPPIYYPGHVAISVPVVEAANCTAVVPSSVEVDTPVDITITAKDRIGNPVSWGGELFDIDVTGDNPEADLTVTDNGDGSYTASYTPTTAGTDTVTIQLGAVNIVGSPFTVTVETVAVPTAANTTADVPAQAAVGVSFDVIVQVKDQFGANWTSGGDTVVATLSGSETGTPTVTDETDGTYTFTVTPTTSGTLTVTITLNASNILDSPFTVAVSDSLPDASNSTADVPSASPTGIQITVTIQIKDNLGLNWTAGGDTVVVQINGDNPDLPDITDNEDGTYSYVTTPTVEGTDSHAITFNDDPISGSPYSVDIADAAPSAVDSTANVPATGTVDQQIDVTIQIKDQFGSNWTQGGDTVVAAITGANEDTPSVTDNLDGTYSYSYTPTAAGTDSHAITLNTVAISGSPFEVTVSAAGAKLASVASTALALDLGIGL